MLNDYIIRPTAATTHIDLYQAEIRFENDQPTRSSIRGFMLATGCDYPVIVDVPLHNNSLPAIEFWMRVNESYVEEPEYYSNLYSLTYNYFPGETVALPYTYIIHFLQQTPNNPVNRCIDSNAAGPLMPIMFGDVLVTKKDSAGFNLNVLYKDITIVSAIVAAAAMIGDFEV